MFNNKINTIYIKISKTKILFPYCENIVGCIFLVLIKSTNPDRPNLTLCSTIPRGLTIAAFPLFDDLTTYFPLSKALESGKYVVRSSNNGKAAIVNPLGIVEQSVKFGRSGFVDLISTKKIQPTIFSQYGNKIFVLLILMYIVLILLLNKKKNE